jgi:predicted deacylase
VSHETGRADAAAMVDYLILRGAIAGEAPQVPEPVCQATPLAASEPVQAPAYGILVFHAMIGDRVREGDVIAEVVDPLTGATVEAKAPCDGVMFARIAQRFVTKGMRLAKVAGTEARRTGKLLSA